MDTGRSHRTADTGHRTLAEDVDTVTKARPASTPSWAATPNGGALDAQPCSSGQRSRRLATMTAQRWATYGRETAARTTTQLLGPAPAKPRLGALLSSDDFGSSVERKAHGQVLWPVRMKVAEGKEVASR